MTHELDLTELRKIVESPGVRPGPWHVYDRGIGYEVHDENDYELTGGMRETFDKADAEFIATFDPPTVLALLSRLEQAEQDLVVVRESQKKIAKQFAAMGTEKGKAEWRARDAEQAVARVREVLEHHTFVADDKYGDLAASQYYGDSELEAVAAKSIARALDGETNE